MKALIVYCHPKTESFNAAILTTVKEELEKKQAEVKVKDLYRMNFNPVFQAQELEKPLPDVLQEQKDVAWADTLIFIYPIWWHERPALLKGWIDRVFSYGFAYQYGAHGFEGLLHGKKALVFTTAGADAESAKKSGQADDIKAMVHGTLEGCGFEIVNNTNFYAVDSASDEGRKAMLAQVREIIKGL